MLPQHHHISLTTRTCVVFSHVHTCSTSLTQHYCKHIFSTDPSAWLLLGARCMCLTLPPGIIILFDRMRSDHARSTQGCQWRSLCPQLMATVIGGPWPEHLNSPANTYYQTRPVMTMTSSGDDTLGQGFFGTWDTLPSISMVDSVSCLRYAERSRAPDCITNGHGSPMQTTY